MVGMFSTIIPHFAELSKKNILLDTTVFYNIKGSNSNNKSIIINFELQVVAA